MKKRVKSQLVGMEFPACPKKHSKEFAVYADVLEADGVAYLRTVIYYNQKPKCIIFCDKVNGEFCTWIVCSERWSVGTIGYIDYRLYNTAKVSYVSKHSKNIGEIYLEEHEGAGTLTAVAKFQKNAKSYQTRMKFEKKQARVNALMDQLHPLPKDFERWIDNHPMAFSRYLYYKPLKGKQIEVHCTHCGKDGVMERPKNKKGRLLGQKTRCPFCNSVVTYKSMTTSATFYDRRQVVYIDRIEEGLILRGFQVERYYGKNLRAKPRQTITENIRQFFRTNGVFGQSYEFKHTYSVYAGVLPESWVAVDYGTAYGWVYPKNIKKALVGTAWKYSALELLAPHIGSLSVSGFLTQYQHKRFLEYLIKLGLYRLTQELVNGEKYYNLASCPATDPTVLLGVPKEDIRIFRDIDIGLSESRLWRECKKKGTPISAEDIRIIQRIDLDNYRALQLIENISLARFERYMHRLGKTNANNLASDWMDYIGACKKLGYNLEDTAILMPKNFKQMHDRTIAAAQDKANERTSKKIAKIFKQHIKEYGVTDGDYTVTMPKTYSELVTEGKELHHCVASYADKVADGTCIILFLRRADAPDVPMCTAEIRKGEVWQIRARGNRDPEADVKRWWSKYCKKVLKPIEEKYKAKERMAV